ncbi:MAG: DUF5683 domain-containing protein [Saprospiraceae bacterium]
MLLLLIIFTFIRRSPAQQRDSLDVGAVIKVKSQSNDTIPLQTKVGEQVRVDTGKAKGVLGRFQKMSTPKKAALLATFLPGAGQIYNKNGVWWKLPLSYGAYGFAIYTHIQARRAYFFYKDIYELRVKNLPLPAKLYTYDVPESYKTTDISAFYRQKNNFRNNYERSFIWLGAAHLFAIADAFVTAHLKSFDVGDNLSMCIKPKFDPLNQSPMLSVCFTIK